MKLPSLKFLTSSAVDSLKRFPLTLFYALVAVVLSIYMIETGKDPDENLPCLNVILCAGLGLVLSFGIYIYTKKWQCTPTWRILFQLIGALLLIGLYFTFPGDGTSHVYSQPYVRFGLYNAMIHLMVAVLPFLKGGDINGFWNYNKSLFLRFLGSALFSAVLFGGLALALASLHFLFNVELHNELFPELWFCIVGIFHTWFFLGGVPKNFEQLEEDHNYPKGLKIFTQYVMFSLLVLYLIILYAYAAKVIITDTWPKGVVPYLVSSVSVLGILTHMLLYPYSKQGESAWISKFSRLYYFLLIPLVVMLFVALSQRLNDYGITISRYALFALGIWLMVVCIYFIIGRKNIKFVPASLVVTLFLISFGPWGMYSMSERSQVNRLEKILTDSKILVNGKIVNEVMLPDSLNTEVWLMELKKVNDKNLNDSLIHEVTSIVDYLHDHHGCFVIRSWFKQDLELKMTRYNQQLKRKGMDAYWADNDVYQTAMGVTEDRSVGPIPDPTVRFDFVDDKLYGSPKSVSGRDFYSEISMYTLIESSDTLRDGNPGELLRVQLADSPPYNLMLWFYGDSTKMELKSLIDNLIEGRQSGCKDTIPSEKFMVRLKGTTYESDLFLESLKLEEENNVLKIKEFQGYLLSKKR